MWSVIGQEVEWRGNASVQKGDIPDSGRVKFSAKARLYWLKNVITKIQPCSADSFIINPLLLLAFPVVSLDDLGFSEYSG